jgi:hypothetical protein
MVRLVITVLMLAMAFAGCGTSGYEPPRKPPPRTPAPLQPLRPLTSNPRYFTDGRGEAVYLTGFHTWSNLVDRGETLPPPRFDYARYLDRLQRYGHNFIRLWAWELPQYVSEGKTWHTAPQPWLRSGRGDAQDGLPKFDLSRFNKRYFQRLRERVEAANARRIYVSVMLFEGWEASFAESPLLWRAHPTHAGNNVNEIAADLDRDGHGLEYFTLSNRDVLAVQRTYVRRVVEAVGDLPNVLFEVANEAEHTSTAWQLEMMRTVRRELARRGLSRPVGMTFQHGGSDETLYRGPADWVSPGSHDFGSDPPLADSRKVSLLDTDHVCGVCGDRGFVWESFLRGYNVIFMDDLSSTPAYEDARVAMGWTLAYADRLNLARMEPRTDLASTRYCLADEGAEYLVYQPTSGPFTLRLRPARRYSIEWFRPSDGRAWRPRQIRVGGTTTFRPPFAGEAVLYVRAASSSRSRPTS